VNRDLAKDPDPRAWTAEAAWAAYVRRHAFLEQFGHAGSNDRERLFSSIPSTASITDNCQPPLLNLQYRDRMPGRTYQQLRLVVGVVGLSQSLSAPAQDTWTEAASLLAFAFSFVSSEV
jgi:hypothetical protein